MKKTAILLACAFAAAAVLSGCAGQPAISAAKTELVVAMELQYPPFETTDGQGNPAGLSVDMAKDLGAYLGLPVRIENMAYAGLVPALVTGKADVIISSMTITDERKESVDFSDPYAKAFLTMLVCKDSPVQAFADLQAAGRKAAVKKGTTAYLYASKNLPEENVEVFDQVSSCVLEVSQGRADAFIYDPLSVYENWQANPDTTRPVFAPFQTDMEFWGIAVRKDNPELLGKINEFLKEYRESGQMGKLSDKYLGGIKKVFDEQGLSFFFDMDPEPAGG